MNKMTPIEEQNLEYEIDEARQMVFELEREIKYAFNEDEILDEMQT